MIKGIGNTPIAKIIYEYNNKINNVYAKLEYYNLTGSIKDRIAYFIIDNAKKRGELREGMPIVEATSGNTGIAISAIGAMKNHNVYIFMPDWVSEERKKIMELYGANVRLFSKYDGGFKRCIKEAEKFAKVNNYFYANQFSNPDNVEAHYQTTGVEIIKQVENIGAFVSGIGTGGTLTGISKRIKEKYPEASIYALEPKNMPLIKENKILGPHKLEGIGDEFIPKILDRSLIKDIFLIDDDMAIGIAREISAKLGLGIGISSAANFIAAVKAKDFTKENVVTVFADDNKKYLTTDLANTKYTNKSGIKLIDAEIIE